MDGLRLFLVDDHKIFREGLKNLIEIEQIGKVVAEAANGQDFINKLSEPLPDLVLMDISMPVMDGIEATRRARERFPDLMVLALSMHGDEEYYYKMIEAGVKGFLLKDSGIKEIERAIQSVVDGESYFSNELLRKIISGMNKKSHDPVPDKDGLSVREVEVLGLICEGLTNEEIGDRLCISAQTVKGHRSNLLAKTNCKNSASLVMYAIKHKLVQPV
ncbi:LuxR family two component transcriptional regulator [Breznakibacter xylanolyticus]|uniref:LuxR family two component transcriptional regulator n=1 Tax=Breznakibacter xylanolyticus TaxID=990 RepID=A0A2W7NJK6_9BACT|nr:response regulator transcription factor [Breznakibacter xylanolyticus]MBN2742430.1 response regulator transcription factor [Marinilabiliaceae bacterium]PZX16894.1 LuxR family two component transcriptional regulator [Breznakibacter xylanolyticus]